MAQMNAALEKKQRIVKEVHEVALHAHSAVAAEYIGMSVAELTELRRRARAAAVELRVVKNTLARRALRDTPCECMVEHLGGPLMLAFSRADATAAPRLLRDFARDAERPVVRFGAIRMQLLSAAQVVRVADLPTRDEALSRLAAVMFGPVTALVRVLRAPQLKLLRLLVAIRDQKS